MTDRELLEAAAKAAGIKLLIWQDGMQTGFLLQDERRRWNPLTDDGDALRLAIDLDMGIEVTHSLCVVRAGNGEQEVVEIGYDEHRYDAAYSAARYAIVCAAAALAVSDLAKMEGAK